ncbi:hypothetical protein SAMN06313540_1119 [Epsilonproteobacteria bacterium SCGC AD-308-E02]|nr:hypothetical protein SAMN06313540_1119 [Epsilonproteobacteria bacterium SCGC AD-308-E02]
MPNDDDVTLNNSKDSLRKQAEKLARDKKYTVLASTTLMTPKKVQELVHELQVHQIELEMQNSELLKTQESLRDSQKRYYDLYNMAPIGYCTISKEGFILEGNLTASKLLGVTRQELIQKPITNFIFKEDQDIYYFYRKKFLQSNEETSCELRMIRNNGTQFWAHLSATSEIHEYGFQYIRLMMIDITENKKAQEEIQMLNDNLKTEIASQLEEIRKKDILLMEQATLAQMGEMINMIAHQWRQPLNAISGASIELALLNMRGEVSKENITKSTKFIQEMTQRMSQIIDDFMNFNKKSEDNKFPLLNIVEKTYAIIEAQFKDKNIVVNIDVDKSLKIFHNKRALEHSLLNILLNSRDAFDEHPDIKKREINIYTKEDDDTVLLLVEDNAGGITQDIIGKIFNPYFTTKEQGKGTGLGLYMTKQMIEKVNNCTISVESQDNQTTFTIKFPKN